MKTVFTKILVKLGLIQPTWVSIERFHESWKQRIRVMSSHIHDEDMTVVDLGCGPCWLREYLKPCQKYIGVDYMKRNENQIVADFNKYQFPEVQANVHFVSGCLEYVRDWKWFIEQICLNGNKCILSYCTSENQPLQKVRNKNAWVNSLSAFQIIEEFDKNNFVCSKNFKFDKNNDIFIFNRKENKS